MYIIMHFLLSIFYSLDPSFFQELSVLNLHIIKICHWLKVRTLKEGRLSLSLKKRNVSGKHCVLTSIMCVYLFNPEDSSEE